MKYSEAITISVKLDNSVFASNAIISGTVHITNNSEDTILIDKIVFELLLKHQGKGETDNKPLERQIITAYKAIKPNETLIHEVVFDSVDNVTYIGQNVTQNIILQTKVDISKISEKEMRNRALGQLKVGSFLRGVFNPDFHKDTLIKVNRGDVNYSIKKANGDIRPGISSVFIILISLAITAIGGFLLYKHFANLEIVYGALSLFIIVALAVYYYKLGPSLRIGKINYRLNNVDGNFYEAVLNFEKKNHNLREVTCQLIGVEQVTYDNGSSRSTTSEIFYKSPIHIIKRFGSSIRENIELPNKSLPITLSNNDFKIIWKLKLVAITNNNHELSGESIINLGLEDADTQKA